MRTKLLKATRETIDRIKKNRDRGLTSYAECSFCQLVGKLDISDSCTECFIHSSSLPWDLSCEGHLGSNTETKLFWLKELELNLMRG